METKNAGFFVRAAAVTLDSLLALLLLGAPLLIFTYKLESFNLESRIVAAFTYIIVFGLLSGFISSIYYAYFTSKFGGTLGKLAFGLRVVDKDENSKIDMKRAFWRNIIGYPFSSSFFLLGFFRVFKNPERLAWHDEIFNTKVVAEGKKLTGIFIFILTILLLGFVFYVNIHNVGSFFR